MHRIDTPSRQKDKFGSGKDGFTKGDPQTGTPATEVSPDILDAMQEEIAAVIEDDDSGLTLDKNKNNQLVTAVNNQSMNQGVTVRFLVRAYAQLSSSVPYVGFAGGS